MNIRFTQHHHCATSHGSEGQAPKRKAKADPPTNNDDDSNEMKAVAAQPSSSSLSGGPATRSKRQKSAATVPSDQSLGVTPNQEKQLRELFGRLIRPNAFVSVTNSKLLEAVDATGVPFLTVEAWIERERLRVNAEADVMPAASSTGSKSIAKDNSPRRSKSKAKAKVKPSNAEDYVTKVLKTVEAAAELYEATKVEAKEPNPPIEQRDRRVLDIWATCAQAAAMAANNWVEAERQSSSNAAAAVAASSLAVASPSELGPARFRVLRNQYVDILPDKRDDDDEEDGDDDDEQKDENNDQNKFFLDIAVVWGTETDFSNLPPAFMIGCVAYDADGNLPEATQYHFFKYLGSGIRYYRALKPEVRKLLNPNYSWEMPGILARKEQGDPFQCGSECCGEEYGDSLEEFNDVNMPKDFVYGVITMSQWFEYNLEPRPTELWPGPIKHMNVGTAADREQTVSYIFDRLIGAYQQGYWRMAEASMQQGRRSTALAEKVPHPDTRYRNTATS